jgi:hypothetical protein
LNNTGGGMLLENTQMNKKITIINKKKLLWYNHENVSIEFAQV